MASPTHTRISVACSAIGIVLVGLFGSGCSSAEPDSRPEPARIADPSVPQVKVAAGVQATMLREEHDRLIASYTPVSEYANVLMSAHVLYSDGTVPPRYLRAAIDEYERRLRAAHIRLQRVSGIQRSGSVRQQLRQAVSLRRASMQLLRRDLRRSRARGPQAGGVAPQQRGASDEAASWKRQWSASAGAAREAVNAAQNQRAAVGLEPMQEDAFR
jgi:hypothetical protein